MLQLKRERGEKKIGESSKKGAGGDAKHDFF